jgi:hypothetical protein
MTTRKRQWSDPKVWVPLLTAIIASIVGPIAVLSYQGFFNQDNIPPTLNVPQSPVEAEATSLSGASVSYTVSAIDNIDNPITPSCEPPSGSIFPIAKTLVTCTAKDSSDNSDFKTFTVTVRDSAPNISVPAQPIKVNTTGPAGVSINYANVVSAADAVDGAITLECTPNSGSIFQVGSTSVSCTASDTAGNTATGSFTVLVARALDKTPPVFPGTENLTEYSSTFLGN